MFCRINSKFDDSGRYFLSLLLVFASMLIVGVCVVYRLLSEGERVVLQGYIQRVCTKLKNSIAIGIIAVA